MNGGGRRARLEAWLFPLALALALPLAVFGHRLLAIVPGGFGAIALALALGRKTPLRLPRLTPALPLLAIVLWSVASLFWSHAPDVSIIRLTHIVLNLGLGWLFVFMARQHYDAVDPQYAAGLFLAGAAVALAVVGLQVASGGEFYRAFGMDRPEWDRSMLVSMVNPAISVMCVLALPGALLTGRAFGPWLGAALVIAFAVVFGLSESMSGKLGLVVALVVGAAVWRYGQTALRAIAGVLVALTLLVPATVHLVDRPFATARTGLAVIGLELWPSALHRAEIYDFTLARIAERPWLGWGIGASRALPGGQSRIAGIDRERLPLHPHDGILEVWVELGPVGGLSLAALMATVVLGIGRWAPDRRTAGALAGATAAYVFIGLVSYSVWSGWWVATGLLAAGTAGALFANRPPMRA